MVFQKGEASGTIVELPQGLLPTKVLTKVHGQFHSSSWRMLKRLVALSFIFFIVGQVSAGVCGCLSRESRPQHSCCKRQKPTVDALRQKGCCDSDCAIQRSEKLTQDRTSTSVKITSKAMAEPAAIKLENFTSIAAVAIAPVVTVNDHRLKYSRPPELYLRHHAFLI